MPVTSGKIQSFFLLRKLEIVFILPIVDSIPTLFHGGSRSIAIFRIPIHRIIIVISLPTGFRARESFVFSTTFTLPLSSSSIPIRCTVTVFGQIRLQVVTTDPFPLYST
jgi:hypothetical protein